jgi:N-acetylmuramoyl-L-alanine amidase
MRKFLAGLAMTTAVVFLSSAFAQPDSEQVTIAHSSDAFSGSLAKAVQTFSTAGFDDNLQTPSFGSLSDNQFSALVQTITSETPIPQMALGERGVDYDVILQPGHYGRITGRVGTSGALVSERALVAYIVGRSAQTLRAHGLKVLVVSADNYLRDDEAGGVFDGLKAQAFLSVHADGSVHPCTTGPSLAYAANSSLLAMHAIGYSLSAALGYNYEQFNHDNFTANEADYYMFRQVQARRLAGLLEVGELTCPTSERMLINSANLIADNLAQALIFIVTTNVADPPN